MKNEKIMIIDDEKDMLENCERILERNSYTCISTDDPSEALSMVSEEHPVLVLTDLRMPRKSGMEILKEVKNLDPSIIVIVFTAFASIQSAVEAMKEGAFDFIAKPFSADQLLITIERALNQRRLERDNVNLRTQIEDTYGFDQIIGNSPAINKVFEIIKKVAKTDANVLIYGESGTGKELTARSIHANSKRRDKAFVPVDCVALSENLLESELFGHEKGSFTGAHAAKTGLFELADEGTFFLDEIGKMNLLTQAKLLRVIQEKQFRRVGGSDLKDVDFRVISTTNLDLNKAIEEGTFIEDLFWRINVITIEMPSLRDRKEDIELLANHFLNKFGEKNNKKIKGIARETMDILKKYHWPGNIRELQNVIERATSLTDSHYISPLDLEDHLLEGSESGHYRKDISFKSAKRKWLESFEKKYFFDLLKESNGNISHAAKKAGIDRKTIYRIMKKHGLDNMGVQAESEKSDNVI
jgi:DNA-binding NtrC family response regulator